MDVLWKENNVFYNVLCVLITENEKLFDRSDARLYWKTVFHMMTVLHHVYVVNFARGLDLEFDLPEIQKLKRFRLAYLTGWNFAFQTTFLSLALAYDVLQWLDKHKGNFGKRLRYVRDVVFNGLVVPFTCFVNSMFWIVYWIDRELVFPAVYDQILPWWLNHCVHTNIIIVVLVETLLQSRRYPTDVKVERVFYIFISLFYAVVFYSIYFFAHCWLYGVFGVMNWWQVCLYQLAIWMSAYIFYKMAFIINRLIHAPESDDVFTEDKSNGDLESKSQDLKQFESVKNASEMKSISNEKTNGGFEHDVNGDLKRDAKLNGDSGEKDSNGYHKNNNDNEQTVVDQTFTEDNGKDWRSIETNGRSESADNCSLSQPSFEKSWSTKYRTNRNQVDNSSL